MTGTMTLSFSLFFGEQSSQRGRGGVSLMAAGKLFLFSCPLPPLPPHHVRYQTASPFWQLPKSSNNRRRTRSITLTYATLLSSETIFTLSDAVDSISAIPVLSTSEVADGTTGYSLASYYTSLGLFVISVPGLWSLIKRSAKSKIVQKTFVVEGEEKEKNKKAPNQMAGEILSFFTRNNFSVVGRGETVTFEGIMVPNRGQAALLTFCTCISLVSVGLVLSITIPEGGNNWFWLTTLSPLAGAYYWTRAARKEEIKVKMIVADDGTLSEVLVQGDDQQVEMMRKELKLSEKGMVYVKGIFER